jgi:hypothetical protein
MIPQASKEQPGITRGLEWILFRGSVLTTGGAVTYQHPLDTYFLCHARATIHQKLGLRSCFRDGPRNYFGTEKGGRHTGERRYLSLGCLNIESPHRSDFLPPSSNLSSPRLSTPTLFSLSTLIFTMKLSAFGTFLPLLLLSSVAHAATTWEIRARQAHTKRSLVDVCAALDLDVQLAPQGV